MKRFLALLALVLVLMAGTAGMTSALTLDFDDSTGQTAEWPYIPPLGSPILSVYNMLWHDGGGGHLYSGSYTVDNVISFTNPTYVNSFQMNGLPYLGARTNLFVYGPMTIAAFDDGDGFLWTTTVDLAGYTDWDNWLTVAVNTPDVKQIIFYSPNREGATDVEFNPSIDNLVYNNLPAVPIPPSVWLLGSGLLALVGLRRKFTR